MLIAFSQGASVGAGVIVAQFLGAKDKKATQDAVHTAFFIAINKYISDVLEPTAAKALLPTKFPTIIESAVLYNCCNKWI